VKGKTLTPTSHFLLFTFHFLLLTSYFLLFYLIMKIHSLRPLFLLLTLSWATFIYYLSSQPGLDIPSVFPFQDKLFHAFIFGILGFLSVGAMKVPVRGYKARQVWGIVALVTLYAILDELHQLYVPGRSADIYDVIADMAGGMAGAWVMYCLMLKAGKR